MWLNTNKDYIHPFITDKKFLNFFFKRLKTNHIENQYRESFPYLSPCGRERNYIRCEDRPIVFSQILDGKENDLLVCNHCGEDFTVPLEPQNIFMLPLSGRIYHPAPDRVGGVGLIKSSVAIEISSLFEFGVLGENSPPVYFNWKGTRHKLSYDVLNLMSEKEKSELEWLFDFITALRDGFILTAFNFQ